MRFQAAQFPGREVRYHDDFASDQFFRFVILCNAGEDLARLRFTQVNREFQQLVSFRHAFGSQDFADAARRHGAEIRTWTGVTGLLRDGDRVVGIETADGPIPAGDIVLATNAYSILIPELRRKQTPAFTYMIATEPLSPTHLAEMGWAGREGVEDARNLIHYYRISPDGRHVSWLAPVGGVLNVFVAPVDNLEAPRPGVAAVPDEQVGALRQRGTKVQRAVAAARGADHVAELRADELPVETAGSLRLVGASTTDRDTLLRAVLRSLTSVLADPAASRTAYRQRCSTVGRQVRLLLPADRVVEGPAEAVDDDGRLVVDGIAYGAGDVVHLRPVT